MNDYTKLLNEFPEINPANYGDDEVNALNAWGIAAHTAIEALQAENERLTYELQVIEENHFQLKKERAALQSKLDELQRQEPVIDFTVLHQFASDQAISYNKLCTAVRMCLAAPKALAPLTDDFLQSNDYYLLHRFIEKIDDGEGYDITKTEIKRLADLGVVQSHGFGRYSVTMFGYWVHERYWEQNPSLPLKTNSDRAIEAAHRIK